MTQEFQVNDQTFTLHPSGAAYWREEQLLLLADLHLGKVTHFRKSGIPVPAGSISGTYKKLNEVVSFFNPGKICFLGDLFHSHLNNEWLHFEAWAKESTALLYLTLGNHDIIPHDKLESVGLILQNEIAKANILLTHHPEDRGGYFNICGHIHPGITLKGPGRQKLRLPCFHKSAQRLILPAFGDFTGKHIISPEKNDTVYAVTPDEVILISD